MKQPKTAKLIIEPLSADEISAVIKSIDSASFSGSRDLALFSLMLDTGLRLSEVTGLKDEDVHIEDQYIKALGKGNKERIVAFGVTCRKPYL